MTTPVCQCGNEAVQKITQKDGENKGRPFWTCSTRACKFFKWANGGSSSGAPMGRSQFTAKFGPRDTEYPVGPQDGPVPVLPFQMAPVKVKTGELVVSKVTPAQRAQEVMMALLTSLTAKVATQTEVLERVLSRFNDAQGPEINPRPKKRARMESPPKDEEEVDGPEMVIQSP
jgi:hypothetical protein